MSPKNKSINICNSYNSMLHKYGVKKNINDEEFFSLNKIPEENENYFEELNTIPVYTPEDNIFLTSNEIKILNNSQNVDKSCLITIIEKTQHKTTDSNKTNSYCTIL